MKKTILPILTAALLASVASTQAQSLLRVTEAMSSSGTGGTPDWIELTNLGDTAANINGWKVDDSSRAFGTSILLNGITSIAAGESVVFFETSTTNLGSGAWATVLTNFRSFWGGLSGVQVGYYGGSGIGLSSSGDGVAVFNSSGTEQATYVSFGAATAGTSFNFVYDASGGLTSAANALSVAGEYGATTVSAAWGGTGTPVSNTAGLGVVPEPSSSALLGLGTIALLGLRRLNRKA